MDLTQLANLGEFIGGVAVLVTLVYLALQIRHGNSIERTETQRAFVCDWSAAVLTPMRDPDLADLLRRANRSFEGLSDNEQFQVFGYYGQVFIFAQQLFSLNREGRADPALVEQINGVVLSLLGMPGVSAWFEAARPALTPSQTEYLDTMRRGPTNPSPVSETYPAFMASDR